MILFPSSRKPTYRGFTLIELLVVIAIIGILSSVVLASLGTAREKARDAKRIAEMKDLQKALTLYFDSTQSYPPSAASAPYAIPAVLVPDYIPSIPTSPITAADYQYLGLNTLDDCGTAPCDSYGLFVPLERYDNVVLNNDADQLTTTVAIDGTSVACDGTSAAPQPGGGSGGEQCYDLSP